MLPAPTSERAPLQAATSALNGPRLASLSAFFPARDEEADVLPTIEALRRVLPWVAECWELIVVDDGSRDRTGMRADEAARDDPRVRVVHHGESRGYGAAVRSGLAAARYDHLFLIDGDRQFDPAELSLLVRALESADVAVGRRRRRADPLHRRASGRVWNALVRRLLGLPLRDVNCAFKLFRREVLAGIELRADGAAVSAELMAAIAARGHRIVEVPVTHFPRRHGRASGGGARVAARALVELARVYRRARALADSPRSEYSGSSD